jgi:uncharacterized membrane protein YbhN (UPF0104 family)
MTKKLKQAATTIAKIGFAVGLIFWMINRGAFNISDFSRLISPAFLAFAVLSVFLQIYINNYRWLLLLRGQGIESSILHTLPLSFIGLFFNYAMPGGVGGDVVKGYYLLQDLSGQSSGTSNASDPAQLRRKKFAGALSIFMDRMMGFFVMIAMAFLALFFNWKTVIESRQLLGLAIAVAGLFLGFMVFFFLSLSRILQKPWVDHLLFRTLPGGNKLRVIYDTLHSYRAMPMILIRSIGLSAVSVGLIVLFVYVIAKIMGFEEIPFSVFCFLVPVGVVVLALPISPAGIGVGQAAFFFLFNLYLGKESQLGPTAITVMQVVQLGWGLVGALFYLQRKPYTVST